MQNESENRFSKQICIFTEVGTNEIVEKHETKLFKLHYKQQQMCRFLSDCELTLLRPVLHSFQMSSGRCGATERRVTAGGEILTIWRREGVELTSTLNEQGRRTVTDTSSSAEIIESNVKSVVILCNLETL